MTPGALITAIVTAALSIAGCVAVVGQSPPFTPPAAVLDTPPATTAPAGAPAGSTPTWGDEFDGPAGQPPDPDRWRHETGPGSEFGDGEWEYYTDRPENAAADGRGNLVITARRERLPGMSCEIGPCDITSARLVTDGLFAQRYGRFEARIKVPGGAGMWPAFWMLPATEPPAGWPDGGEIDVMEYIGTEPSTAWGTVHGPGYYRDTSIGGSYQAPGPLADGFHTYAVEWGPEAIAFFCDDVGYFTVRPSDLPAGSRWVFDTPFSLLLNLAVGGPWPGYPDATTPFPATMTVDYVRVYQRAS